MRSLLQSPQRNRVILAVVVLALVIGMFAGTKFQSVTASASDQPKVFSATTYAQDKWPDLVKKIAAKAVDVTVLAAAVDANLATAGKKYGQNLGAGSYAFAVKATGTVATVDANFLTLTVPKLPAGDVVRIPLGAALNGAPIRDATGTIQYGDFADQSDYQDVANALQIVSKKQVLAKLTPSTLKGKQLTVTGAFGSGGPAKAYLIDPVQIQVAS